ncbi:MULTISPECIES: DLW-39 family protein [unclassified Schaalia]|nr:MULTISPECIES: DLW-39 family protein [unclassified Schaalia]MCD4550106.1 DLW-39 family protein [Schaalia sp. lx-260]MCD4557827.1 DLW-39 family protein [Schaalia sp. lx-100]
MRKWITTLTVVSGVLVAGLVIRQIMQDLSDNANLWKSVTDEPALP